MSFSHSNPNENLFFYLNSQDLDDEKHSYKNRMKEVNLLLTMNGFNEIGDLFDPSLYSVNKTLNLINLLIADRQKLLEAKSELLHKVAKSEAEYLTIVEKSESTKEKVQDLTKKNEFFKNKLNQDEKKFKEDLDRLRLEKIETEKSYNRIIMKESQYKHEIKKNEKEIEDLKVRVKKLLSEKTENIKEKSQIGSLDKNSANVIHNINHFKEFYNLIFQALNEKVNQILSENEEMKSCYKVIMKEIYQYVDYKKLILYKFNQDSIEEFKSMLKDNAILNFNIFELDFIESKEIILTNFNEILNAFRFVLVYDILKVDPSSEFDFDELKKSIINKKYDFDCIPYYKQLKETLESLDFTRLRSLKEMIIKSNLGANITTKRKSVAKDEIFLPDANSERIIVNNVLHSENKGLEYLEEINKEMKSAITDFDMIFENLEKEVNNLHK